MLYSPRTVLYPLAFSFRKGSEAALLGPVAQRPGGRVSGEPRQSTEERARAPGQPLRGALSGARSQKPFRAQEVPFGCKPLFVLAKPAA